MFNKLSDLANKFSHIIDEYESTEEEVEALENYVRKTPEFEKWKKENIDLPSWAQKWIDENKEYSQILFRNSNREEMIAKIQDEINEDHKFQQYKKHQEEDKAISLKHKHAPNYTPNVVIRDPLTLDEEDFDF